jgi:superfamily II DNA helicase RecQ
MYVKVVTLRYEERLQGFPEAALREAAAGREVLEVRDHFFLHGGVPHLALVLLLGDGAGESGYRPRNPNAPDPEEGIAEERRPLYRELKRWRNERAKADGKPAYAIARNAQLAEIVNRAPKSLEGLKAVEGIGEGFCRDYGAAVLELVRAVPESKANPDGTVPVPPESGNADRNAEPTSASATGVPPA